MILGNLMWSRLQAWFPLYQLGISLECVPARQGEMTDRIVVTVVIPRIRFDFECRHLSQSNGRSHTTELGGIGHY